VEEKLNEVALHDGHSNLTKDKNKKPSQPSIGMVCGWEDAETISLALCLKITPSGFTLDAGRTAVICPHCLEIVSLRMGSPTPE
jgi:hypothetical protein